MNKSLPRFLAIITTLLFGAMLSGCSAGQAMQTALTEIMEAYDNVAQEVKEAKTWVSTKIGQTEEAIENVKEATDEVGAAAESVGDAVDSLKEVTDLSN